MTKTIEMPLVGISPEYVASVLLRIKPDLSDLDMDELLGIIVKNLVDALQEIDLDDIIKDSLAECTGMDRDKWDAALSIDSKALFIEMLENGQNAEVRHE